MSYRAIITKLENIREHSNADKLNIVTVFGNQVVIGKDMNEGDKVIYFPTDGQLSEEYCRENNLFRHSHLNKDQSKVGFVEDNRRVKTLRLRGEPSDGLIMPITSLNYLGKIKLSDGDAFTKVNESEVCKKYISNKIRQYSQGKGGNKNNKKKKSYPFFKQHIYTSQLAYNLKILPKNVLCVITEKLHGTSGRITRTKEQFELTGIKKWLSKIFKFFDSKWEVVSGSRRVILDRFNDEKNLGYYETNEFRKYYHDLLKDHLQKGETIYFEIIGWVSPDKTIMDKCKNSKLNDKAFVDKYGDETIFSYGCKLGHSEMYVYRITKTDEDGNVFDLPWEAVKYRCIELGIKHVPELKKFINNKSPNKLLEMANKYADGESTLDSSHIREGVVFRFETGRSFCAYKHKSFEFKVLENIIKSDESYFDIEEAEDLKSEE